MPTPALMVLDSKSVETHMRDTGSRSWRLQRDHAERCEYVVCVRNAKAPDVQGREPHRSAYLIARIRDVILANPDDTTDDRYLVRFNEFARLNQPDAWPIGIRNPVHYSTLEELGIDPATLRWEQMPTEPRTTASGLTIAEAKAGLGLHFGVPPEAVEITIRG
jgi:hypothetical protein